MFRELPKPYSKIAPLNVLPRELEVNLDSPISVVEQVWDCYEQDMMADLDSPIYAGTLNSRLIRA